MARRLGEALIGITPDTTGFLPNLQAKLKTALAALKPEVPVGANTAKLDAAIAAARAKVAGLKASLSGLQLDADAKALAAKIAAAKAGLAGLEAQASRLKLNADTTALIAKIAGLQAQQAHLAKAMEKMTADVDIRAASTKILAIGAEVRYLQSLARKISVGADWSALNAAIAAARAKVAALQDEAKNVKIGADTAALTAKLAAAEAELKKLEDQKVNIDTGPATANIAKLGGAAFTAGGWFGFLGAKIPLFGTDLAKTTATIFNSVTVFHLLADGILEVGAVVIPAAIALAAFGVASSSTVRDIVRQEQAYNTITTAMKGMNVQFPGLNRGLQTFTDSVKPQVYVLFGEALNTINAHTGLFQTLAVSAGQVLDNLGARAANALGGNGLNGLVAKGADDLQLLGNIIGNVFGIFGNILKSLPGYAGLLFSALQAVTGALQAITSSSAVQFLLQLGLALHGAVLYGGLAVTAMLALQGPLTAVGGWIAKATVTLGLWITEMILADGAAATFAVAMAPLAAISPFTWIALAVGGLVALAVWLGHTSSAANDTYNNMEKLANSATSFTGVNAALVDGVHQSVDALDHLAGGLTNPDWLGYVNNIKNANSELDTQNSRLAKLNTITGSTANTQAAFNAIGIKNYDLSKLTAGQLAIITTEIQGYQTAQTNLAGFQAGPAAAAQNALTNMYLQETLPAIQKITQAEDNLLNVVTGGQVAFNNFQQSIQGTTAKFVSPSGLADAAALAGGNLTGINQQSLAFSNTLYNISIPALQKLVGSLQAQSISTGDLAKVTATGAGQMLAYVGNNQEARSVIVDLINNALGPGTVTLKSLNQWVGTNSVSLGTMNSIVADSTIKAGKLTGVLSSVLTNMEAIALFQAHGGQNAWNTFATDLTTGQTKSKAFQTATQNVMAQLLIQTNGSLPAAKKAFEDYVVNGLHLGQKQADELWQKSLPALAGAVTGTGTTALNAGAKIDATFTNALRAIINVSPGLQKDIGDFTNAIITSTDTSTRTHNARIALIQDLVNSGLSGKTAAALVQGLQDKIDALHGKSVNVGVTATASGSLHAVSTIPGGTSALNYSFLGAAGRAGGGMISGGTPGKDSVLGVLMPGEVVVPTSMVKAGAVDHLRGKLPGFAAGGGINIGGPQNWMAQTEGDWGAAVAQQWAQAANKKFQDAATAAAKLAAGSPVNYSRIAGVTQWEPDVAQVLSMLGLPQSDLPTVMSQILTESGGNPNAINLCLTLDAAILTRRGLVKHDDVRPGDETIGYNFVTGCNEWTTVTAVHHYEDAPLVRIGNTRWHATVTPEHRWVNMPRISKPKELVTGDTCPLCPWPDGTRRRGATTAGGLRIHLAKAHGQQAVKQENGYADTASWIATKDIRSQDRLVLSAVADTGPGLDITEREAAVLGWIAGDGHVEKYADAPRGRKKPTMSISQSKPAMVAKLTGLMDDVPCAHYIDNSPKMSRVNKKPMLPYHQWRLDFDYAQDLMRRAGHPKEDAVRQVLAMSTAQRRAWLDAFIDAEGHRDGEYVSVTQAHGPVLEAAHLAIYLCGYRPRLEQNVRQDPSWSPTARISAGRPVVSGSFLTKQDAGRGEVWCVTTELGSWTAEQDGQVFLTGNSDINAQRGDPSRGLMQVIGGTFAAYRNPALSANIYDPLANIYAGVNYAIHQYGNPGWLNVLGHGHGYAAGGLVGAPGYAAGGLAADQVAERGAYGNLVNTVRGALARPIPWVKAHEKSLQGELVTLGKRQAAEQAAYSALSGRGLTRSNASKFATQARAEIATDRDQYLSTVQPTWTDRLARTLNALIAAAAAGTSTGGSGGSTGGGTGTSGAVALGKGAVAALARDQAAERASYARLVNTTRGALAHPSAYLKSHRTSILGELGTLAARQGAEQAAYAALSGKGLTKSNLSKFATKIRAEVRTDRDKYLSTAEPGLTSQLAATLNALVNGSPSSTGSRSGSPARGGGGGGHPAAQLLASGLTLAQYRADLQEVRGLSAQAIRSNPHLRHIWHLLHEQHLADLAGNPYARGGLVFDNGGTLSPGPNLVYNQTGRAEHLSPDSGGTVEVHLHVHGPVGSQPELERWLLQAVREAARVRGGGNVQVAFGRN